MNTKICCFAGHRKIYDDREIIKAKLEKEIINLIETHNVTTFYNGGKGDFDWLCAHTVANLKKDYPFISSHLVLAYIPKEKNKYADILKIFDSMIYPGMEKTPPRFAIIKRNQWMINYSDVLIAYVKNRFGGAYKTLQYAERKKNIKIINLVAEKSEYESF